MTIAAPNSADKERRVFKPHPQQEEIVEATVYKIGVEEEEEDYPLFETRDMRKSAVDVINKTPDEFASTSTVEANDNEPQAIDQANPASTSNVPENPVSADADLLKQMRREVQAYHLERQALRNEVKRVAEREQRLQALLQEREVARTSRAGK